MLPDRWYPVLESSKLRRRPVGVKRLGQRWVLWRDAAGHPVIQPAACPHRAAALEQGRVVDGELTCPWHGFRFAADGHCTLAPCEGEGARLSPALRLDPAPAREEHGLVWMWWGRAAPTADVPFFSDVPPGPAGTAQASYLLPYHYTRMVETNLDIHHTPFVHGSVIPGLGARMDPFEAELEGDHIRTWGELRHEGRAKGMPFRAEALLPCLGLVQLTPKLRILISSTPVDDDHTWMWFRYVQGYTRIGWLGTLIAWLAVQSELRVVQRQDWRIFRGMTGGTLDEVPHRLVRADRGIALYRRRRRELLDALPRAAAG